MKRITVDPNSGHTTIQQGPRPTEDSKLLEFFQHVLIFLILVLAASLSTWAIVEIWKAIITTVSTF